MRNIQMKVMSGHIHYKLVMFVHKKVTNILFEINRKVSMYNFVTLYQTTILFIKLIFLKRVNRCLRVLLLNF